MIIIYIFLGLVGLCFIAVLTKNLLPTEDIVETQTSKNEKGKYGPYIVERVIDGDTLILNINNKLTRVRLLGINAPESVDKYEPQKNCEDGRISSAFMKKYLTGKDVLIELGDELLDKYDRVLVYVYYQNKMVNALLVRLGLARAFGECKYANSFKSYENMAFNERIGMWKNIN